MGYSQVSSEFSAPKTTYSGVGEAFIRMSLLTLMGIGCFLLLRPFLHLILTGMIVAIAIYPAYQRITKALRGRKNVASVLCTVLLMAVILLPALLLAGTLADGI